MVSFIIPTYNAKMTINRCIESLLEQNKTAIEYEIIIVDDGSNDGTEEIIKSYINNKVKYFQKANGGVASARNYGINQAQGDYIIFVDSDDYVNNTLLNDIEPYISEGIELIKWNPIVTDETETHIANDIEIANRLQKPQCFEKTTGEDGFNKLFGKDPLLDCLWNYAIKKDIIMQFPENTYHEDFAIMPQIILKAKTMVAIDKYEYFYVQTANSIMRNNDEIKEMKKLEDILNHYDNLINVANTIQISDITKDNLKTFATNSLIVIVPDLREKNKKYFIKELKKRKIAKNIKAINLKQLIKKILLTIKY